MPSIGGTFKPQKVKQKSQKPKKPVKKVVSRISPIRQVSIRPAQNVGIPSQTAVANYWQKNFKSCVFNLKHLSSSEQYLFATQQPEFIFYPILVNPEFGNCVDSVRNFTIRQHRFCQYISRSELDPEYQQQRLQTDFTDRMESYYDKTAADALIQGFDVFADRKIADKTGVMTPIASFLEDNAPLDIDVNTTYNVKELEQKIQFDQFPTYNSSDNKFNAPFLHGGIGGNLPIPILGKLFPTLNISGGNISVPNRTGYTQPAVRTQMSGTMTLPNTDIQVSSKQQEPVQPRRYFNLRTNPQVHNYCVNDKVLNRIQIKTEQAFGYFWMLLIVPQCSPGSANLAGITNPIRPLNVDTVVNVVDGKEVLEFVLRREQNSSDAVTPTCFVLDCGLNYNLTEKRYYLDRTYSLNPGDTIYYAIKPYFSSLLRDKSAS